VQLDLDGILSGLPCSLLCSVYLYLFSSDALPHAEKGKKNVFHLWVDPHLALPRLLKEVSKVMPAGSLWEVCLVSAPCAVRKLIVDFLRT
jgi:hypothetical protein